MCIRDRYYVVDTDLTGLFRLCREVARLSMIPNNYGRIVNVSSMHGFVSRKQDVYKRQSLHLSS